MKYVQILVDNSPRLTGLVLAVIGVLTAFKIADITEVQSGAIMALLGAVVLFLSSFVTTVKRTVVTQVDSGGTIRNGPASTSTTGTPTTVIVNEDGSLIPQATVDPALAVAGQ